MARYATTEELYKCPDCLIKFALRESVNIGHNPHYPIYNCPSCDDCFVSLGVGRNKQTIWNKHSLLDLLEDTINEI